MGWKETYRSRVTSASQALEAVQSDMRVYIHPGSAEPEALVGALIGRAPHVRNVEIVHILTLGRADYVSLEMQDHFRHVAFFIGSNVRQAVNEGHADYIPIYLGEIEGLMETGAMPIDVALIQVSPPDDHGFCSFGVGVDITLTAAKKAKFVVAQVNHHMPRTYGDSFIHVNEINAFVEHCQPLCELAPHPASEEHLRIATHVASLIDDGATLQMGIGGIPDAVLTMLGDRKDLGVHSEMVSDGVIPLVTNGVITGARKSFKPRKIIVGFVLGSKQLFDFVHDNPIFEFHPTSYTNDPWLIARNDNMVAINAALQMDLTGQVCSDSIGSSFYSGFGGQVDFIRGAARSKGGKPIIALPSTAKGGTLSRITPMLSPGAGVVTNRADVHYVVTEFGIAYLHGKSVRQRAEALIEIAHPNFRAELSEYCERNRSLSKSGASFALAR